MMVLLHSLALIAVFFNRQDISYYFLNIPCTIKQTRMSAISYSAYNSSVAPSGEELLRTGRLSAVCTKFLIWAN